MAVTWLTYIPWCIGTMSLAQIPQYWLLGCIWVYSLMKSHCHGKLGLQFPAGISASCLCDWFHCFVKLFCRLTGIHWYTFSHCNCYLISKGVFSNWMADNKIVVALWFNLWNQPLRFCWLLIGWIMQFQRTPATVLDPLMDMDLSIHFFMEV
jgi:hypothetical protein